MINKISEIPFWGPEEQIRRFINQHDDPIEAFEQATVEMLQYALNKLQYVGPELTIAEAMRLAIKNLIKNKTPSSYTEEQKEEYFKQHIANYLPYQQTITQQRLENLDEIYQKQLIWSYGLNNVDDAYFYQDWCPIGEHTSDTEYNPNPKWQMDLWGEAAENIQRSIDRSFDFRTFKGYQKSDLRGDEMPQEYDASTDAHANSDRSVDDTNLDVDTLRHNIMWSYLEVSEWLGDEAIFYGSQNGFVSRKMSLAWLFNAIKALINWKLANQDKWAEVDIHPLVTNGTDDLEGVHERFLAKDEPSTQGHVYDDYESLDQMGGCCNPSTVTLVRAKEPWKNGVLKVRGNEFHYGERAYFWTHTSFVGECRFFHNARFLGQATFDKEINGTAMRSRWADLAEYKESDRQYEPGTLVMFGGEKEITLSRNGVANAVVTTKPGLVLNGDEPSKNCTMVGIVLTGTAPVKISRPVKKFDKLVADAKKPGYARPRKWWEFWKKPIAITLEGMPNGEIANCITKMEF